MLALRAVRRAGVEYRVLGPVQVHVEGKPAAVGGPKPRALLALLLLNPDRVVPTSQIIEALWGGHPPASGATRVHGVVSELRAAFARAGVVPAPIGTHPHGYLFTVTDGQLDLHAFERRLAEARTAAGRGEPAAAAAAYRAALGLWRGPALTGVTAPFADAETTRLEERRLVAVEELMEAELALGRHAGLVGELTALVARHPLRERLRQRLMLALYRAGRQAEALEVYQQGRQLLVEQLGLEPGPELERLQRAILAADPELLQAGTGADPGRREVEGARPPAQLPPDVADFTGRHEQAAWLRAALKPGPQPAATAVAVVSGKPGVGKTALALHVAHGLRPEFPDGQLYVDLRGAERRPLAPHDVLERFLRGLGVGGGAVPAVLEERRDLYRSRLADRRVLVVLDNAADEAQVRPLLPGGPGCAVLVTGRARLAALAGARRLDLDVLDPGQATELLGRVAGPERITAEPDAAQAIAELCGHLPLAVRVAGARLAVRRHWRLADLAGLLADERRRLDELAIADIEVRASLALSYEGLDPEGRRLFRRLGLLAAPTVTAWVAAAALDGPLAEAERLLDGLADAHLAGALGTDANGQVRYRFHDLIRLYARERADQEEPAAERDAALARCLGAWLALAETADPAMAGGGARGIHGGARRWRCEPEPFARLAAQPTVWFESERVNLLACIRQACHAGLTELAWDLAASTAFFFSMVGYQDWREVHRLADAAARGAGDARGQAALLVALGWVGFDRTPPTKGSQVFARARESFERLGDLPGTAEALLGEGNSLRLAGRPRQALACLRRARALAVQTGAPDQEAAARFGLAMVDRDQGRPDRTLAGLRRILPVWRQRGARRWEVLTVRMTALALGDQGDLAAAEAQLRGALALADELDDAQERLLILVYLGELHYRQGELETARAVLDNALRRARELGLLFGQARALHTLGELHAAEGDLGEALRCLTESVRLSRLVGIPRGLARALDRLGAVQASAGDAAAAAEARQEARRVLAAVDPTVSGRTANRR
jgi:DNA-binding SARP family transcriptional activator/tetratricopeptide (TPR) repeat protein